MAKLSGGSSTNVSASKLAPNQSSVRRVASLATAAAFTATLWMPSAGTRAAGSGSLVGQTLRVQYRTNTPAESVTARDTAHVSEAVVWPRRPVPRKSLVWGFERQVQEEQTVLAYLEGNPKVRGVVWEVRRTVPAYFGAGTQVALEVLVDSEDDPPTRELFAVILTPLPFDQARATFDRFRDEWWLQAASRADFQLGINLKFV